MYYLQKVIILLERKEEKPRFLPLIHRLEEAGISMEESTSAESGMFMEEGISMEEGALFITDSASCAGQAVADGRPVFIFLHEKNRDYEFGGVRYAFETPEEMDVFYLERVYRRLKGLPWDILDTKRCHLRETTEEDVEAFYEIYKDPSITQHMEDLYPKEQEKAYIREYIEKIYSFYEFGVWTVVERETGDIIGRAGYSYREGFEDPEIGFVIGVPWQRRGFAYEICTAILEYGREELGFERVRAMVEPGNEASLKLCRKLGMEYEKEAQTQGKKYFCLVKVWQDQPG